MKNGVYKRKLFGLVFSIFLVGVIALTCTFYIFVKNVQKQQDKETAIKVSEAQYSSLNIQINVLLNYLQNVVGSQAIMDWTNSKTLGEQYYNTLKVQQEIKENTIDVEYLEYELGVTYLEEQGSIITPTFSGDKFYYFKEKGLSKGDFEDIQEFYRNNSYGYLLIQSIGSDGEELINYIVRAKYPNRDVVFVLTIKEKSIFNSQANLFGDWILFNKDQIISESIRRDDRNVEEIYEQLLNFEHLEESVMVKKQSSNRFELEYKDLYVVGRSFSNIDWHIAYIMEKQSNNLADFVVFFLLPLMFFLAVGFIFIRWLTNKLYSPINQTIKILGEAEEGYVDEFQLISSNVKEIKLTNEQLRTQLKENDNLIEEKFYKDVLLGVRIDYKQPYDRFKHNQTGGCVAVFDLTPKESIYQNEEIIIIKNDIKSFALMKGNFQYVNIDAFTCALIYKESDYKECKDLVRSVLEDLEDNFEADNITVRIALGHMVSFIFDLKDSYKKAMNILEYKYLIPDKKMLTREDLLEVNDTTFYYPLSQENQIIQGILNSKSSTIDLVENLIEENFKTRNLSFNNKKNFIIALNATINRIQQELKLPMKSVLEEEKVMDIIRQGDASYIQISDAIVEKFNNIYSYVENQSSQSKASLADEMTDFINNNYKEDIMLNDLAEAMNLSEKYCSKLFKKLNGANFKDVLNTKRIKEAKLLLSQQPDIKINDLAESVGFNSANSFIRVFKKYVGMSPGVYAKIYKEDE